MNLIILHYIHLLMYSFINALLVCRLSSSDMTKVAMTNVLMSLCYSFLFSVSLSILFLYFFPIFMLLSNLF